MHVLCTPAQLLGRHGEHVSASPFESLPDNQFFMNHVDTMAPFQLVWNDVINTLQAHLDLGLPLLLEVARYLGPPASETLADPAFGAYHALLQLDLECAQEQLQEPGAVAAAGNATAVCCMSWALQQGKVAAAALPAYTAPTG